MMALRVVSELFGLAWRHPLVSFGILLLFTPPFFPIIRFFSPLLISTAVFVVAMVSLGPNSSKHGGAVADSEDWDFRKSNSAPDGVRRDWEDSKAFHQDQQQQQEPNGEQQQRPSKKRKSGGGGGKESWVDWVKNVEAIGLAWVDQKRKNEENWPAGGQMLNDHNVSILQEAFGQENLAKTTPSPAEEIPPSYAGGGKERGSQPSFSREKVAISGESVGKELPVYDESPRENGHERRPDGVSDTSVPYPDGMLGEDAEDVVAHEEGRQRQSHRQEGAEGEEDEEERVARVVESSSRVLYDRASVPVIQIPAKSALVAEASLDSPTTDVDDDVADGLIKCRHKEAVSLSTLSRSSDADGSSAIPLISDSGKLSEVESLAEAIESQESKNAQEQPPGAAGGAAAAMDSPVVKVLQPSTSEKVNDIIEKLKVFCADGIVPPPPLPPAAPPSSKQSSPLFKPVSATQDKDKDNSDSSKKKTTKKKKPLLDSSDDDTSSGDEVVSDSDSDSGFQIFPARPTADIKVHPPMKLDKMHLEQQQQVKTNNPGAHNTSSH